MEKLDIDHMWGVNRLDFHHTLVSGGPWVRGGVQALFPEQQLVIQFRSWGGYNYYPSFISEKQLPVGVLKLCSGWDVRHTAHLWEIPFHTEKQFCIHATSSVHHIFFYIWFTRKTNMAQMFVGKEESMKLLLWIVLCSRKKLSCELYFDWILS